MRKGRQAPFLRSSGYVSLLRSSGLCMAPLPFYWPLYVSVPDLCPSKAVIVAAAAGVNDLRPLVDIHRWLPVDPPSSAPTLAIKHAGWACTVGGPARVGDRRPFDAVR